MKCDVCSKDTAIGVASVPGVPMSAAYCRECLTANAHPYDILVNMTACNDGLSGCHEGWHAMVNDTLKHLGRTMEKFELDVAEAIKALNEFDPKNLHDEEGDGNS